MRNNDNIKFLKSIILFCSLALLLLCIISLSFAQGPDTLWTKTYGGTGGDSCWTAQQTVDGGYILAGCTKSFGLDSFDIYLVKTDSQGDTLWTRTYGGPDDDECTSVQQTSDEGYIIAGLTESFGAGGADIYLIKTDLDGDTIWTKTYGWSSSEFARGISQTRDGGYIIAGYTDAMANGEGWLLKTDANGDTSWTKIYGGADFDAFYSAQQTSDDGYLVTGMTASFGAGSYDIWIMKTDSIGDSLWTFVFGGSQWDKGNDVLETADGYYLVVGWTWSFGAGSNDICLIKIRPNGDTLWAKFYGGPYADGAYSVRETNDGDYIIAGITQPAIGNVDLCLLKTNANGDSVWARNFGGSGFEEERGWSGQQTTDGGYMIAGWTESFGAGGTDFYLVKTAPDTFGIEEQTARPPIEQNHFGPTILSGPLVLPEDKNCKVFDITGRVVAPDKLRPGIYFVEVDGKITRKVVKVR